MHDDEPVDEFDLFFEEHPDSAYELVKHLHGSRESLEDLYERVVSADSFYVKKSIFFTKMVLLISRYEEMWVVQEKYLKRCDVTREERELLVLKNKR